MKKIYKIFVLTATVLICLATTSCLKSDVACSHEWIEATCTTPQTCAKCAATSGTAKEHTWSSGSVTTNPTCIKEGITTFTCLVCNEKKEVSDVPIVKHDFSNYEYDNNSHWRTCNQCNYKETEQHTLNISGEFALCSVCNSNQNLSSLSYRVSFVCDDSVSITVYSTQDYTQLGTTQNTAYSKDGNTGDLLKNGKGQVNFKVNLPSNDTYLYSIEVRTQTGYGAILGEPTTGVEDIWRITDITTDIEVVVEITAVELPIMEIYTQNNASIVSKEDYIKCKITIDNSSYELTNAPAKIRGRGNSTWDMPKKPYRIKFDEKTDLFGNGAAKDWTLIANYADKSLMRNYLAYEFGRVMDGIADTTTTTQMIELYLNGAYQGVYLVCEQMETGSNRVDIEDDINSFGPEDIGYLLEFDYRVPDEGTEDTDYIRIDFSIGNEEKRPPHAIKSPDYEDIEGADIDWNDYVTYIKEYTQECSNALNSGNYELVKQYMDVNSFAESYIVHELMHMIDVGYSSFYVYKEANGKLFSGPLWDFDISVGNCDYHPDGINPESLWAKDTNWWYAKLLEYPEFQDLVGEKLVLYESELRAIIDGCVDFALLREQSFNRNFEKWQILDEYVWPNSEEVVAINTWQGQVEYVQKWLNLSLSNLLKVYVDTYSNL